MSEVFTKVGTLKVKNGTYKKDNAEHNRWHEVGVLFSSPHGSNMFIKLHATATSEPKLITVFKDEDVDFTLTKKEPVTKPAAQTSGQVQAEIMPEDIVF